MSHPPYHPEAWDSRLCAFKKPSFIEDRVAGSFSPREPSELLQQPNRGKPGCAIDQLDTTDYEAEPPHVLTFDPQLDIQGIAPHGGPTIVTSRTAVSCPEGGLSSASRPTKVVDCPGACRSISRTASNHASLTIEFDGAHLPTHIVTDIVRATTT
ncbi:hypothetical protein IMZ11_39420 [Microtetraspora sp. AC03309]|uniref:hypothetical protein n=1 Tax=Microtetraspora sp. AC03309 TaxID=2779376 RepID=UPI001E2D3260|nr:hypothetical protein [Microtetraspora sp. AC03309]MCC5581689.1 hypothetical protein [Microtetraspora sp. AC03309]